MPLVSRQIPALFNGVSQQPATLRLPSQGAEQVNGWATVVDGLRKRPPFEHVARVTPGSLANSAYIHAIDRDKTERYIVVITDGDLKVYDLDGNEKTVNFPLGKGYLSVAAGEDVTQAFSVVTIADYSFVVNKTVAVGTKAPTSTEPADLPDWYFPEYWEERGVNTGSNFAVYDNQDVGSGTYKGVKQTFSDLPNPDDEDDVPPAEGDIWEIEGYDQDSFGSYWVIRKGGVWEETFAPGDDLGMDESTMPHALVREADGTFSFTVFPWKIRKYGDAETNPAPSFVGRTISDIFYYKNRLAVTTGENIVFSCAGDYGNFWRNTVTDLLDSDVVDVAVSSTNVSILRHAVPFANKLMLFADQTQFALNVDELLTPTSVSVDVVTSYEMNSEVKPVPIGNDVYFVTETGNHSRVREYFVRDREVQSTAATDISSHVPRYIPKNVRAMAGNSNEDALFLVSKDEPNALYTYKFFWNENGKAQSAWSKWEIDPGEGTEIIALAFLENILYILVERTDGVFLEKCDIQSGYTTGGLDRAVLLDRLCTVTGTYVSAGDYTEFTLPYPTNNASGFELVRGESFGSETESLIDPSQYTWIDASTIRVPGDESAGNVYGGQSYTMEYLFSEQFMMNGDTAITTGRLQLRTFVIYFTDTAFFKTEVDPYGNGSGLVEEIVPASLSEFTGKTLGSDSLKLGEPAYHTGQYAFQVYGHSRDAKVKLINDTHVQSSFQSAEWEGLYFNRARSI